MTSSASGTLTKEAVFERLQTAVRDFFNCPDEPVSPDTVAFDIDGWDSLAHATFMLDLEDRFSIRFNAAEVLEFENLSGVADAILGHLINGSLPHEGIIPKIRQSVPRLDPAYRTLIFNFNNAQVIQAEQNNGFWQELDKRGYSDVDSQGAGIDWTSNFLTLPCLCNPKDYFAFQIRLASPSQGHVEALEISVNGRSCPVEGSSAPNVFSARFRARDYLDVDALEGANEFRLQLSCPGQPPDDVKFTALTMHRTRWADGINGKTPTGTYSGESLWGDLWRVGSRQFLMQLNDSFHGAEGANAPHIKVHAVGDSHAIFDFAVNPECKTHYVNAYSVFHLIKNPIDLNAFSIPDGSKVMFVFGEIDCRTIIGSMADRMTPGEFSTYLATEYARMINRICQEKAIEAAVVLPGPPVAKNVAADTLFPVVGSLQDRIDYTRRFCDALRALEGNGCITGIIDAYTPYASEEGILERFFAADEAHLRPDRTDPLFAQAMQWIGER